MAKLDPVWAQRFSELSPWLRVWYMPRTVSKQLLHSQTIRGLIWVIPAAPVATALQQLLVAWTSGASLRPGAFAIWMLASFVGSILLFIVGSILVYSIGRMNGGKGSRQRVRLSVLVNMVLSYMAFPVSVIASVLPDPLQRYISLLLSPFYFWLFFVQLNVSAGAHSFSTWNAFVTKVMGLILILIPSCCLAYWTSSLIPWQELIRWVPFS